MVALLARRIRDTGQEVADCRAFGPRQFVEHPADLAVVVPDPGVGDPDRRLAELDED